MTGSLARGTLLGDDLSFHGHQFILLLKSPQSFMTQSGDETGCTNPWTLVWGDPISHEVWDTHHPMSAS